MKKACLVVQAVYQKNEIFNPLSPLNRDDCLQFFHDLQSEFAKNNINLQTQDQITIEEADLVIYNEMPKYLPSEVDKNKSYLLLFESELIKPQNWNLESHAFFQRIFTWNENFVDQKKYFKFNFTHSGSAFFLSYSQKEKFCTLIAGHKSVDHPLELYSKRVEAIRWFEKNHPDQFEFFGMGWGLHTFKIPFLSKILNRIKSLRKMRAGIWPSYRGPVANKLETLKKYKFSICYENARDISGYVTEKIFDSMAAGCIPIYWGAPQIKDMIPALCFIDKTEFKTYEQLYSYLSQMTEDEYNQRLQSIKTYLKSDQHKLFEPSYNAQVVAHGVLKNEKP